MMDKNTSFLSKCIIYLFLVILTFSTLVPIAYTVSASFKPNTEIMSGGAHLVPKTFTISNYVTAWTMGGSGGGGVGRAKVTFAHYTLNSIILSLITMTGSVMFTSMAAYCFQRGKFPGRVFLYNTFLATMFIGTGSVTLFPIVKLAAAMGINNLYGAAIVQIFTSSAANLFLTMGFLKTISREIDDSAKIDGCSFFRTYYSIILPLCKPILATIALISFRFAWNDYLMPMVMTLGKPSMYPLVVGVVQLKNFGGEGAAQYNLLMAGTMFSILPMIVIFLVMNRYFISGMTEGALKG
jgi:multiple sugar transport system permease protein